jgi:DNA gyrase/topoisomerase IV subunit B
MTKTNANKTIEVLSDFEHIVRRPTMYVGSVKKSDEILPIIGDGFIKAVNKEHSIGMYKLFDEVFSNSVDEAKRMSTPMKTIVVEVDSKNNFVSITDSGDGFTNGSTINKKSKLSNIETAVSMLRAGSNFDNDDISESIVGTNGFGVKLVNALSDMFEIETINSSEAYLQTWISFKSNKPTITTKKKGTKTGTRVSFIPNSSVFDNSQWDYSTIRSYLCLRKRVLETEEKTVSLKIEFIWNGKTEIIQSELKPDWSHKTNIGEILVWEKRQDSGTFSFVNSALCTGIHQKIVQDRINIQLDDTLGHHFYDTLIILNMSPKIVRFGDQNKTKFVSKREEVEPTIVRNFDAALQKFFKSEVFKKIKKAVDDRRKDTELKKIRKEKKGIRMKNSNKYFPATSARAENLFIVEGLCIDENEKINIWRDGELINAHLKDVLIGDEVVTHKNRIRKIINKQRKLKECLTIRLSDGTSIKQPISHQYYTFNKKTKEFSFKTVGEIDKSIHCLVKSNFGNFIGTLEVISYSKCKNEKYPNQLFLDDGSWYQFSNSHKYCVYNKKDSSFIMKYGKDIREGELICVFDFI